MCADYEPAHAEAWCEISATAVSEQQELFEPAQHILFADFDGEGSFGAERSVTRSIGSGDLTFFIVPLAAQ